MAKGVDVWGVPQAKRAAAALAPLVLAGPALADGSEAETADTAVDELKARLERQETLIRQQQDQLHTQRKRLNSLQSQVEQWEGLKRYETRPDPRAAQPGTVPDSLLRSYRAAGTGSAGGTQTAQGDGGAAAPGEQPETERPEIRVLERSGGVLLREGQMAIEPSFQYTFTDVDRVEVAGFTVLPAIVVGQIEINQRERESFVYSSTLRYGVTDTFEIEARVPYVFRNEDQITRPLGTGSEDPEVFSVEGDNLGDVEFAMHYQVPREWTGNGFVVTNVRYKSRTGEDPFEVATTGSGQNERQAELPTGSGFRSVTPSVTGILPVDPAVIFGNVSYEWTFERDIADIGTIDPGDQLGFNVGTGLSLTPEFSLSLSYDHSTIFETTQNGQTTDVSRVVQVGRMVFGGTYNITDNVAVDLQFATGVTDDAPDISASVSIPITFQAF